jgi:hypothetical protein
MAAVRLSRLQKRLLPGLAADAQRTRWMSTRSHQELGAALPRAKGNIRHSLPRLERQGLIVMLRTAGGKTASGSRTAAGRQQAIHIAGSAEEGALLGRNNPWWGVQWPTNPRERNWRGLYTLPACHETTRPGGEHASRKATYLIIIALEQWRVSWGATRAQYQHSPV